MTVLTPIPPTKAVRDLFSGLVGQDVDIEPSSPVDLASPTGVESGVYVDDRLGTVGVAVVELELAAALGAAIGLMPPGAVEAALEDGELSAMLHENVREVLNVSAALFNGEGLPHVKLYSTYLPGETPPDVAAQAATLGRRLDLKVTVGRYGSGHVSFVLV